MTRFVFEEGIRKCALAVRYRRKRGKEKGTTTKHMNRLYPPLQ